MTQVPGELVRDQEHGPRLGGSWPLVAGVAALAVSVGHVAQRTALADGAAWTDRVVARLDLGTGVLIAVAGAWLHADNARRRRDGRPVAPWSYAFRRSAALLALYWAGLVVALAVGRPSFGLRQLLGAVFTLPPVRETRVPAYGQGWILGLIVLASLAEPIAARLAARLGDDRRRQARWWLGLAAAGLVFRVGLVLADRPAAAGPLERLPGHLHLLAVGAAAVSVGSVPYVRRGVVAALGVLGAGWLLAGWIALPSDGGAGGTGAELARLVLGTFVAGAAVMVARTRTRERAGLGVVAGAAIGAFVVHQAAADLVLRQYVERRRPTLLGPAVVGAWIPPLVWSMSIAVALGFVGSVVVRRGRRPTSPTVLLASVVAGGFLLRVVALFTVAPPKPDGGDPLFYHTTANLLAQGRGFIEPLNWIAYGRTIPSALHGPAYPVYLSVFSRFGATTIFDHRMASILAGTGVVLVAGLLGRRVAGDRAMLVAAVLAAVYPNLWIIDGVLFPEGLFVLCSGLVMLAAFRWMRTRSVADAALVGLLIGVAAMVRGEGLFLSVLLVVPMVLLARELRWSARVRHLVFAGLGCVVALAPWTIRNATTFEAFVSLSTNGDELNVYANCADTYEGKYLGFWLFDCQERIRRVEGEAPGDEAERAKYWRDVGWDYARDHVEELPKVVAARVGRQWELFRPLQNVDFAAIEGRDTRVAGAGLAMYYLLVPAAIAGAMRLRRRGVPQLPLVAQFLSVTLTAAYAYGTVRFRAPAELSLSVLAGVGLVPVVGRVGRWWASSSPDGSPLHDPSALVLGGRRAAVPSARRRAAWRSAIALGGLAALLLAPLRGLMRTPGAPMEEGFMLTFPERVLKGDIPNVDFLHLYGPGSLKALAAVYWLFGVRIEVERLFGFGQHAVLVLGLYVLLRAWGRVLAAGSAGLAVTLIVTPIGLDALAWTGALALGVWSVVAGLRSVHTMPESGPDRVSRRWAVAAGVLAGLALTFRPDLVVAVTLAHVVIWWRRVPVLRWVLGGAFIGSLPMIVHLARAGVRASVEGMLLDPVFALRPGRTLPRPPSWDRLDGALQVIAEKFPPWWGLPSPSASQQLVLWFWLVPLLGVGLVVVAARTVRRRPHDPAGRVLLAASLFSLGIVQQGFQRPDSAHFAWVTCISLAVAPAAAAELIGPWRPAWRPARRSITLLAGLLGVYLVVMPFFSLRIYALHVRQSIGQLPPGLEISRGDRRFYLGDVPPWRASQQLIDDLNRLSVPGERLLVGPVDLRHTVYSDAVFYYLFPELEPATYFIEMDPGVANAPDSGLAEEVASADWLVLTRFWAGWIEPNTSVEFGPDEPNQVVESEFCLVGSYEHDLARLYQRCEGGGAPGPYEGPYDPDFDPAVEVRVPVPRRPDGTCTPTCADQP